MTSENTLRHPGTAGVNDPGYPHDGPWIPPCPSTASRSFDPNRISLRGRLVCHGPAPRVITYESQLERKTALVLLARPDVVSVHDQPKPVTYTDVLGNESRHTFDFLAIQRSGTKIAVSVKPEERAARHDLRTLLQRIAEQMPAEFADRVILVTENDLHRDLVHDAELIHEVRGDDAPEDDRIVTGLVGHLNGMTTVGSLVAASGLAGRAFRAAVRLIADGSLRIVGPRRIGYATQVERVGGLS